MGGQQKDFISDIVFFQHQDGMRLKVPRHFLQCSCWCIQKRAEVLLRTCVRYTGRMLPWDVFFSTVKGINCKSFSRPNLEQFCFLYNVSGVVASFCTCECEHPFLTLLKLSLYEDLTRNAWTGIFGWE